MNADAASLEGALGDALDRFAHSEKILVATDFDGVLAPLVLDPMTARPTDGTIDTLRALAASHGVSVAIVSGRDMVSLRTLTGITPSEPIVLVGSHGAEASVDLALDTDIDSTHRALLERCEQLLQPVLREHPGVYLEHKPAGVVLHTRRTDAANGEAAVHAAERATESEPDLHIMHGKEVLEFSVLDVSKGHALEALARRDKTAATLYLGDDVTDEKAFVVLPAELGHVSIKVGAGHTDAQFRVTSTDGVPAVFERVLRGRG